MGSRGFSRHPRWDLAGGRELLTEGCCVGWAWDGRTASGGRLALGTSRCRKQYQNRHHSCEESFGHHHHHYVAALNKKDDKSFLPGKWHISSYVSRMHSMTCALTPTITNTYIRVYVNYVAWLSFPRKMLELDALARDGRGLSGSLLGRPHTSYTLN